MNKETKKLLREFVQANCLRLAWSGREEADLAMGSPFACALAPNILLPSIRDGMSTREFDEYRNMACQFTSDKDIKKAYRAFAKWLKEQ